MRTVRLTVGLDSKDTKMGEIVKFPEGARTDLRHMATDVLVRLFREWDGAECDRNGVDSVKGYSVRAIQDEVNRRGDGRRVAV